MPVHFAASRHVRHSPVARILAPGRERPAHNDNGIVTVLHDPAVRAALELFGEHGLGAARFAAQRARATEGHDERARWIAICALLDRRLADTLTAG